MAVLAVNDSLFLVKSKFTIRWLVLSYGFGLWAIMMDCINTAFDYRIFLSQLCVINITALASINGIIKWKNQDGHVRLSETIVLFLIFILATLFGAIQNWLQKFGWIGIAALFLIMLGVLVYYIFLLTMTDEYRSVIDSEMERITNDINKGKQEAESAINSLRQEMTKNDL